MSLKNSILYLSLLLFFVIANNSIKAQCFASPGNPIAGSANVGILQPRITRVLVFHKFSYSDKYYNGSQLIDYNFPAAIDNANYNYSGFSIGYGVNKKFTAEIELGYFINKTQNYKYIDARLRGYGLSNIIFSGKYNLHKNVVKNTEISVSGGLKVPCRLNPQVVDGVRLDIDVQPSTGNFGFILQALFVKEFENISARCIILSRYENNFTENRMGYRFGDTYTNSLFLSKHLANRWTELTKDITLICQVRHEYHLQNTRRGNTVIASGSNLVFVAPQINFNLNMVWNFSLIYETSIYKHYNATQLGNNYSLLLSLTKDIGYKI